MADALTGGRYEILVGAALTDDWSAWFDGFDVSTADCGTRLRGTVVDQTALHGVLARLRDLGIPILAVILHQEDSGSGGVEHPGNTPPGT